MLFAVPLDRIYLRRKFTTIEQLKLTIVEEWRKMSQRFIDRSIIITIAWHRRLGEIVENRGGHIDITFSN